MLLADICIMADYVLLTEQDHSQHIDLQGNGRNFNFDTIGLQCHLT